VSGIPAEWVSESEEKSHKHNHLEKNMRGTAFIMHGMKLADMSGSLYRSNGKSRAFKVTSIRRLSIQPLGGGANNEGCIGGIVE